MSNANVKKDRALPDLTSGSIVKSLIALAVPIVMSNLLQTAYQLTDTFWVGRLGAGAVAAVTLSFPLIFLMLSVGAGLAIAGTIMVSQYKGQENYEQVDLVSAQTLVMLFMVSAVLSVVGFFASESILKLMGASSSVLPDAAAYLKISFTGLMFLFGYFVFQSLMRGVGDVKTPMYIVGGTVVLNFFLDPFFIMGFGSFEGYGVVGAALATVITQGIAAVVGLSLLFSGKYGIHLKMKNLKLDFGMLKKMVKIGLPSSIEMSAVALGFTIMTVIVATFGDEIMAAYGIGGRIFSFIVIPAMGLAMATSTLVGQNIGAGKMERAEEVTNVAAKVGFWVLTFVGVVVFFTAEAIVTAFIPSDAAVIAEATMFVKFMALSFGFTGLQQTINGAFMGSGNTLMSMTVTLLSLWAFQFPLAYFLSMHTKLAQMGVWIAFPLSSFLASMLALIWFKQGAWKRKKLLTPNSEEDLTAKTRIETKIEEGFESV